jgi:threonine dehydratase
VQHLRDGFDIHVRETAVHLVLETRNREHAQNVIADARRQGFDVTTVGHSLDGLPPSE